MADQDKTATDTADATTEWDEQRREALRVLNGIVAQHRVAPKEIELQNGIVLKTKPVSEVVLRTVVTRIPKPEVPMHDFGPEDAPVREPWPESPEYKEELNNAMMLRNQALAQACQVAGTECLSVPDGYFKPEDDGWIDLLRVIGAELDDSALATPIDRYAAWLEHHAVTGFFDLNKITQAVLMLSAILEEEVWDAIRFFRSDDLGPGADGSEVAQGDGPDGSGVRTDSTGAGDQDGGTGHGGRSADPVDSVGTDGTAPAGGGNSVPKDKADGRTAPKRRSRKGK